MKKFEESESDFNFILG